jgi:hypothetical protein
LDECLGSGWWGLFGLVQLVDGLEADGFILLSIYTIDDFPLFAMTLLASFFTDC